MTLELYSNQVAGWLAADLATAATTMTVQSSTGFPSAVNGVSQFRILFQDGSGEICIVSNVAGTTWTIIRGSEGTTAAPHPINCPFTHWNAQGPTAGAISNIPIYSGNLQSGQIAAAHISSGTIVAGANVTITQNATNITIAASVSGGGGSLTSGAVGSGFLASGSVQGFFGSTRNIASGTVGVYDLGSGAIIVGTIGSGAVQSGNIGSGQITIYHFQSGLQISGLIWSGGIGSGAIIGSLGGGYRNIASGTIGTNDIGSGTLVTDASYVLLGTLVTQETISGVRAVNISQSGLLQMAMAAVSGRNPSMGLVVDNVASGQLANVYGTGKFQVSSGMADWSGYLGTSLYTGRSGQIVSVSGSWNSGGFQSGDFIQVFGYALNSGCLWMV